ncbi:response regulator transcription factor [Nocardioides koreensis]|uniref:response regulator transcription factor n=1 Tax=Nocardioides koreensis TaxID=433651 RepID=UPI0031D3A724
MPIIMLSALGGERDRVAGLRLGADDFVGKPFSPRELVARVDSVLRRSGPAPAASRVLADGNLTVDTDRHVTTLADHAVALTVREFALLRFLVGNPGIAFTREDLLKQVWGWTVGDRSTVTVHVRRLREKIEVDPTRPTRLLTIWGIGYLWEAQG